MTSPYRLYDGLAVYRLGHGEPVLLMPAPHRFERPGLREFDTLADGLQRLGRQVITYDPPGSGLSARPARLSMVNPARSPPGVTDNRSAGSFLAR